MLVPKRRQREADRLREARDIISATTPEPEAIDPTLFDPIDRNPQVVNDAINALTRSRVEGSLAADRLRNERFQRQMDQLILSQVLGVGGEIANLGGSQNRTGVAENVRAALPTALNLERELVDNLTRGIQQRAEVQGQSQLEQAVNTQEARITEAEDRRNQQQKILQLQREARQTARQQGLDERQVFNQLVQREFTEKQLAQGDVRNEIAAENATTARIRALTPSASSNRSTGKRPGERGHVGNVLNDILESRAVRDTARKQLQGAVSPSDPNDPTAGSFQLIQDATAKDLQEAEQNTEANKELMVPALRRADMDEVEEVFDFAIQGGDNELLPIVIDELILRATRNPNDPILKEIEANYNDGAQRPLSIIEILTELDKRAASGSLKPQI